MTVQGIIVGSDKNLEDLLPWWWSCYSRYNTYPVAFADFGLSPKMRRWCQKRGEVLSIDHDFKEMKTSPHLAQRWMREHGQDYLVRRQGWLKKPFACQKSPFDLSLWLDLDCEVCQDLQPVFDSHDPSCDLGVVQETRLRFSQRWKTYNSGVILFKKNTPFLYEWGDLCLRRGHHFAGDDNILSHLIRKGRAKPQELPASYNWMMRLGLNPYVHILHWTTSWGKDYVRKFGGLHGMVKTSSG